MSGLSDLATIVFKHVCGDDGPSPWVGVCTFKEDNHYIVVVPVTHKGLRSYDVVVGDSTINCVTGPLPSGESTDPDKTWYWAEAYSFNLPRACDVAHWLVHSCKNGSDGQPRLRFAPYKWEGPVPGEHSAAADASARPGSRFLLGPNAEALLKEWADPRECSAWRPKTMEALEHEISMLGRMRSPLRNATRAAAPASE